MVPNKLIAAIFLIASILSTAVLSEEEDKVLLGTAKKHIRLKEIDKAFPILEMLSEKQNSEAQYRLAVLYRNGQLVKRDYKKAQFYFKQSAEGDYPPAIYSLAMMIYRGQGSKKNITQSRSLLREALELDYQPAKRQLEKLIDEEKRHPSKSEKDLQIFQKAIRTGKIESISQFLDTRFDINSTDSNGNSILMMAVEAGNLEVVKHIIKYQPDFDKSNRFKETALHIAAKNSYKNILDYLLTQSESRLIINNQDKYGNTILLMAINRGMVEQANFLIRLGADVSLKNRKKRNALDFAEDLGHKSLIAQLKKAGIKRLKNEKIVKPFIVKSDDNKPTEDLNPFENWSALMIAAWKGSVDDVKVLVRSTQNINQTDESGHTPLSRAAIKGHTDVVTLLLKYNADGNLKQKDGSTAIHWASSGGHFEVVRRLIKAGVDVNQQNNRGETPLMLATSNSHDLVLRLLLKYKATVNLLDKEGKSALTYSVMAGNLVAGKFLIQFGANVNSLDKLKRTALWYAIENDNIQFAQLLIPKTRINQRDSAGEYYLTMAARKGQLGIIKRLIRYKARLDVTTRFSNTSLIIAASKGHDEIIKYLLRKKSNMKAKNQLGETAVLTAVRNNHISCVKILISAGADISIRNNMRLNAIDIAKENGHKEMVAFLETKKSGFLKF